MGQGYYRIGIDSHLSFIVKEWQNFKFMFCFSLSSKYLTRAEHLEKSDVTGKSDPYVVLSCQGRKYQTKVKIRRNWLIENILNIVLGLQEDS